MGMGTQMPDFQRFWVDYMKTVTMGMPGTTWIFGINRGHGKDLEDSFMYTVPRFLNYFSKILGFKKVFIYPERPHVYVSLMRP